MSGRLIHLLRHGPPLRPGLLHGHGDEPPAAPDGGLAGAVPADISIGAVVTSDLRRARAGADSLARARGLAVTVDSRWRELDFGAWDGTAPEQLDAAALAQFWDDPDANPPPGGERWSELVARVGQAMAALPPDTLVVTHGGAMRAATAVLTGLDYRQLWAFDLPYAALLSVRIWPTTPLSGQIVGLRARLPG